MTRAFLDALFADVNGQVECRAWSPTDRVFTTPGRWRDFGPFITRHVNAGHTVAVGPATRRDDSNGTTANLAELAALFVDIDKPPAHVADLFKDCPLRWTLVVLTGRGLQHYARLKEPLDLQAPGNLHRAASVLRRLAAYCGGDLQCADPARVLRLPGTLNFKYGKPRPCVLAEQTDAVVNLEEIEAFLPREVVRQNELVLERPLPVGMRNDELYRTARSLLARGVPWKALVPTMRTLNAEWCDEPLPEAELLQMLQHALKQPHRADFLAHPPVLVHGLERRR